MPNQHYYGYTVTDYSDEKSGSKVHFGAVTAINIAGVLAQIGNLRTAIQGIIVGVLGKDKWVGDDTVITNDTPDDTNAQIELKWLVSYEGASTHKRYRCEVPTPDTEKLIAGTDMADMTDTDIASFVTAFEALGKSPDDDTENVNILDMRLVGRTN